MVAIIFLLTVNIQKKKRQRKEGRVNNKQRKEVMGNKEMEKMIDREKKRLRKTR